MPSKRSGGVRTTEAKHRERDAKRPEGYVEAEAEAFADVVAAARGGDAFELAVSALRFAVERAGLDPGMPPEYRRQQVATFAASLGKLADPARKIEELSHELREAHAALVRLRDRDAAQVAPRDPSGPAARPLQ